MINSYVKALDYDSIIFLASFWILYNKHETTLFFLSLLTFSPGKQSQRTCETMTYSNDLIYFKHLKDSRAKAKLSKQKPKKKGVNRVFSPLSVMISHFVQIDTSNFRQRPLFLRNLFHKYANTLLPVRYLV